VAASPVMGPSVTITSAAKKQRCSRDKILDVVCSNRFGDNVGRIQDCVPWVRSTRMAPVGPRTTRTVGNSPREVPNHFVKRRSTAEPTSTAICSHDKKMTNR